MQQTNSIDKSFVARQIEDRVHELGGRVSGTAGNLRTIAQQLRDGGTPEAAPLADGLARYVEQAGTYLSQSDSERLLHDLDNLARTRPLIMAAAAFATGLAASRFVKTSSRERYRARYTDE